jgi:hypothetical protein
MMQDIMSGLQRTGRPSQPCLRLAWLSPSGALQSLADAPHRLRACACHPGEAKPMKLHENIPDGL